MVNNIMGLSAKMIATAAILASCLVLSGAVTPLTPEELQHIRDFTSKAHMKRTQNYPDQIMTASSTNTHYIGRRIPSVEKPPPTFFMQAPSNLNQVVKPTAFTLAPQQQAQPATQNYVLYPFAPGGQPGPIFQQRPQQQLQFLPIQQGPTAAQSAQIVANAGQLRGPQPQLAPQQFNNGQQQFNNGQQQFAQLQQQQQQLQQHKRPSFFSFPESSPHSSIFSFFFPRRPARRPNFRNPLRFEFAAAPNSPLHQHQQNLQNVMAQQHLLTVQQNGQQTLQVQPSNSPLTAQSTTIKSALGVQTVPTVGPSPAGPIYQTVPTATLVPLPGRLVPTNSVPLVHTQGPPIHPNQFHREISFFGKPMGKQRPPQKFRPLNGQFIPQNRPGDGQQYIQQYVGPKPDFQFLPYGPHLHPIIAGPTHNRFNGGGSPVSFSHIEQLPFQLQRPQALPIPMVVQSQEFPQYHFTTQFATGGQNQLIKSQIAPNILTASQSTVSTKSNEQSGSAEHPNMRPQRVRKLKARITSGTTTTGAPPSSSTFTTQSLGDIIFESSKETREFHDTARLVSSPAVNFNNNNNDAKNRKPKQQSGEVGSLQKASGVETSVVLAPLVFAKESTEPVLISTSSPRPPVSSTSVSVSTVSSTTEEPYKSKIVKSKGVEFHKSKNIHPNHQNHQNHQNYHHNHHSHHHNHNHSEKKVTASGAGLLVTAEPYRMTSTGPSSIPSRITGSPGRVVTTSVTSRVVSTGGPPNPNKRYRLRKVKVPNPDAKSNKQSTSPSSPVPSISSSSGSTNTTIIPSTTSISSSSSRAARSTTTVISTTDGSSTTVA